MAEGGGGGVVSNVKVGDGKSDWPKQLFVFIFIFNELAQKERRGKNWKKKGRRKRRGGEKR
jgi:hypothetical protein